MGAKRIFCGVDHGSGKRSAIVVGSLNEQGGLTRQTGDQGLEKIEREVRGLCRYRVAGGARRMCRRYVPHVLMVLVACAISWVLSEWYVEGAFKPLPYFIRQLYVWHFVVVR